MKVVIVSDGHGDKSLYQRIAQIEEKADAFIDAGDSCIDSEDIRPFISVKGNCDYTFYPLSRILYFDEWRVYLTHGSSMGLDTMINLAKSHGCSVLVYGHTHKYDYKIKDSIYCLNPGSIARPRDGYIGTYMVVDFSNKGIIVTKKEVI